MISTGTGLTVTPATSVDSPAVFHIISLSVKDKATARELGAHLRKNNAAFHSSFLESFGGVLGLIFVGWGVVTDNGVVLARLLREIMKLTGACPCAI